MPTRARAHTRFRVDLPVRIRPLGTFRWQEGSLINLSKGGICLEARPSAKGEARSVFETGAWLEVEIPTVDREGKPRERRMEAEVQWSKGRRYGLRFVRKPSTKSTSKKRTPSFRS